MTTPSSKVSVQQIGLESYDAAFALLLRFFREEGFDTPEREMRPSLSTLLVDPDSTVFLAEQNGQAVGVATVTSRVGIEYGRSAELEDLYVVPEVRGRGTGTALIDAVRAWCRRKGCTVLDVVVIPEGEAKHGLTDFYLRRGFANTGRVILEVRLDARGGEKEQY
jgi:aminoglycoside 6'-N-acetyltransferase I